MYVSQASSLYIYCLLNGIIPCSRRERICSLSCLYCVVRRCFISNLNWINTVLTYISWSSFHINVWDGQEGKGIVGQESHKNVT